MLDLQTYIFILLAVAAVGMFFIIRVILKQLKLFKITEEPEIQNFRIKLFALSLVIVVMGLIPIAINFYSLFADTDRPPTVPAISLVYSAGVHLQSLFLSYILWRIYRLADDQEEALAEMERNHLANETIKNKK
jgi:hypothetical protein